MQISLEMEFIIITIIIIKTMESQQQPQTKAQQEYVVELL